MPFTALDTHSNLSPADRDDQARSARWARIAAIAGGVALLLAATGAVLMAYLVNKMVQLMAPQLEAMGYSVGDPPLLLLIPTIGYLLLIGLFVLPVIFLFQYAQHMGRATRSGFDATAFAQGMRVQRNLHTYTAVVTMLFLLGLLIWVAALAFFLLAPPPLPAPGGVGA